VEPEPLLTPDADASLAAEAASRLGLSNPDQPAAETPSPTVRKTPEKRNQELWAMAMVRQASEITASIPTLPPAERDDAVKRAAILSDVAHNLLYGGATPPCEPDAGAAQSPL
jgi:hypothetical protein